MYQSFKSDGKEGRKQCETLENVLKLPFYLPPASPIHHRSCSKLLFSGFFRAPDWCMYFLVNITANSDSSVTF